MQFNPLYSSLNPKLFSYPATLSLRGAKAGHFNLALAEELQWTDEEKQAWVEICSGQRTFSEFRLWLWCMQAISLGNGPVN